MFRNALIGLVLIAWSGAAGAFEDGRVDFSVRINDLEISYGVFAIYVLPEEVVEIAMGNRGQTSVNGIVAPDGDLSSDGLDVWHWRAPPAVGSTVLRVQNGDSEILLNVFVMYPATVVRDAQLNGFRIGDYPAEPLNDNPLYLPPDGFIELNEDNGNLLLSPHFRLAQFPAKQAGEFPKYLVLREQLFMKLELLLERVNANGVKADSFTIMSGYRTPFYNAAIGNVPNSRHVFGGAADIFVDVAPVDDFMDDLNGDGALDFRDVQWLYRLANELFAQEEYRSLIGGLGVYRPNSAHGPFLHVDARAQRARWGLLP